MGIYEDYLIHFNPNHDPETGRFTGEQRRTIKAAKKAVKIRNSRFKPWYTQYDPLLADKSLNRYLDSDEELIKSRKETFKLVDPMNEAFDQYESLPINDKTRQRVDELYKKYRDAEIKWLLADKETEKIAKKSIDRYLQGVGNIKTDSPEYEVLVEYAKEFFPSAPERQK